MKKLFLYLRELLMNVEGLKWVDLDKGQLNNFEVRPAIDFPAALIRIEYPRTTKITRNDQQCTVVVTISIVHDCLNDTDSSTTKSILDKSLEIYDLNDAVHQALQGQIDTKIFRSPLERTSVRDISRPDRLKVFTVTYSTNILD